VYYDLWKLLHKGAVYSRSTSWVFRAAPIIGLAAVSVSTLIVPLGHLSAPLAFEGDLILLAYILGLMRFFIVIGAIDTASAFEGMGASREVTFSALAEPALLLALAAVARQTGSFSLSDMFAGISVQTWNQHAATLLFAGAAMAIVLLAENARIPVDDPNTHLELTMIHEVMVLDNSGPDFAFILYAAALKLWVLSLLLVGILLPLQSVELSMATLRFWPCHPIRPLAMIAAECSLPPHTGHIFASAKAAAANARSAQYRPSAANSVQSPLRISWKRPGNLRQTERLN
jgi:formate hydrogenlyase subunit 4